MLSDPWVRTIPTQQHRSLHFSSNPRAHPTPLLNAIGSGALTGLRTLNIARWCPGQGQMLELEDVDLLPDSLPSLRNLATSAGLSAGLLGNIFAAPSRGLTHITINDGQTVPIAMRLLAENDYAWAPTLPSLLAVAPA